MKNYFLASILFGLFCANFISTPIEGMQIDRVKNSFSLPIRFINHNVYPLIFWGTASLVGMYAAKNLYNYFWRDRERTYEIDGMTQVVISTWPYAAPREYSAVIKNSKTNQIYGSLIYQVQPLDVVYIRRFVIEPDYRKQEWGSKLLKIVLNKLPSLYGCKKVTLLASPLELKEGETEQEMLLKLIKFYEKHGAKVARIENGHTWMVINLTKSA